MDKHDQLIKILVVGESGVGKSALMLRYTENSFSETWVSTIGVDFKLKNIECENKICKLQIWDTAGQERFKTITATYYRGSHAVMLTFDLTDIKTFLRAQYWLEAIHKNAPEWCQIILVGNKCENSEARVVPTKDAQEFADKIKIPYIETSAKDDINVKEAFEQLVSMVIKNQVVEKVARDSETTGLPTENASGGCQC